MTLEVFDRCESRPEVRQGTLTEAMFAANLDEVALGTAPTDYQAADRFFDPTYHTLKSTDGDRASHRPPDEYRQRVRQATHQLEAMFREVNILNQGAAVSTG